MEQLLYKHLLEAELNAEYQDLEQELNWVVNRGFEDLMAQPMRLHISNIPFAYTEAHLKNLLEPFGPVIDVEIITNSRGSKGFGFVTMQNKIDAERASHELHGTVINGRAIEVNSATPRKFNPKQKFIPKPKLSPICPSPASSSTSAMQSPRSVSSPFLVPSSTSNSPNPTTPHGRQQNIIFRFS